jgi:hypothetical protein
MMSGEPACIGMVAITGAVQAKRDALTQAAGTIGHLIVPCGVHLICAAASGP